MFSYKAQCWFFMFAVPLLGVIVGGWVGSELGASPHGIWLGFIIGFMAAMLLTLPWMLRNPPKKDPTKEEPPFFLDY